MKPPPSQRDEAGLSRQHGQDKLNQIRAGVIKTKISPGYTHAASKVGSQHTEAEFIL